MLYYDSVLGCVNYACHKIIAENQTAYRIVTNNESVQRIQPMDASGGEESDEDDSVVYDSDKNKNL